MRFEHFPATSDVARFHLGGRLAHDRLKTDSLRGIACLLIVLFHATTEVQLRAPATLAWVTAFNSSVAIVRVPLFTFLSGYIYAYRPLSGDDRFGYLRRKSRRLLLPMLFVSLATVMARGMAHHDLDSSALAWNWTSEIVRPSFQLWFLEALFLIFLALSLGLYRYVFSKWLLPLSLAIALGIGWMGLSSIRAFSIVQALQMLPYFITGAMVHSAREPRSDQAAGLWLAALIAVGAWQVLVVAGVATSIPYLLSLAALIAINALGPRISGLAWIGRYSMAIFLYHGLVLAALATRLPGGPTALLAELVGLGIVLPILFEKGVAHRLPLLLPLTLGQKAPARLVNA